MKRDRLDCIKELAHLKIEDILETLGVDFTERYSYVVAPCPVHGGSRRDAFSWHLERGIWKCFSRGCEETHGSDIFGLVRAIRKCSFNDAIRFIERFVDSSLSANEIQKLKDQKANKEFIQASRKKIELQKTYDPKCLSRLRKHNYLETRGYPTWLVERYHIGACLEPHLYMSNRIVVPVCNKAGEIVGFTGRTLDPLWKEKKIPKWKHSRGAWVSNNLFNINNAALYIEESSTVILCEGPLDVLRFEQAGVRNSVSILGKKFYPEQMTILAGCGATRIIDALDQDAAGQSGSRGILKTAALMYEIEKRKIPDGRKDIGEMTIEEVKEVFSEFYEETVRN